jgi:hypothetical protein
LHRPRFHSLPRLGSPTFGCLLVKFDFKFPKLGKLSLGFRDGSMKAPPAFSVTALDLGQIVLGSGLALLMGKASKEQRGLPLPELALLRHLVF